MGVEIQKINLLIWGIGKRSEKASTLIDTSKYNILAYVDSNEKNEGKNFLGIKIILPIQIQLYQYDLLLIFSTAYEEIFDLCINKYFVPCEKIDNTYYFSKLNLINQLEKNNYSEEMSQVLNWIKKNPLDVFNYPFASYYKDISFEIFFDEEYDLYYVMHHNRRMYFAKKYDSYKKVIQYYKSILMEQDINSPHRYLDEEFCVNQGDIVIDAGVAEGNFALDIIDLVKKIYLIECDPGWIEALKITFKPYEEKVTFIEKKLSNMKSENEITLDDLNLEEAVNFLKMDIEGFELRALQGGKHMLEKAEDIKMDICCYHKHDDEVRIKQFLEEYKYKCDYSMGFMVFLEEDNYLEQSESLELRRGLIKAIKKQDRGASLK